LFKGADAAGECAIGASGLAVVNGYLHAAKWIGACAKAGCGDWIIGDNEAI